MTGVEGRAGWGEDGEAGGHLGYGCPTTWQGPGRFQTHKAEDDTGERYGKRILWACVNRINFFFSFPESVRQGTTLGISKPSQEDISGYLSES